MNETEQNSVSNGTLSQTYRMNVLYPPELALKRNSTVIENDNFTTTCVANTGLTTSLSVHWDTNTNTTGYNNSTLSILNVKREMKGTYRCLLKYTLHPTYGESISNSSLTEVFLDVLYSPEKFVTNLTLNGTVHQNISSSFSLVENAQITMVCTAHGKPTPTKYSWTGVRHSDNDTLQLVANSSLTGNLTCSAENNLTPTNKESRKGFGEKTYKIIVLYPPNLREYKEENVTIGTNIIRDCIEESGNTNNATVCWTRENTEIRQCNQTLTILNATPDDSGLYNCTVHFVMRPTFGEEISLSISTYLFINVFAESKVKPVRDGSRSSVTAAAVGGALAVVALIVAVIGTLYFVNKRRKMLSKKDKGAKSPAYENTGFAQGVVRNPYEENLNTYEGLTQTTTQNANDHQYEKLRSFSNRHQGQQKLYEKLQLKQLN